MPDVEVTIQQTDDGDIFVFKSYGTTWRYSEDVLEQVEDGVLPLTTLAPEVLRAILFQWRNRWEGDE
jgi:hypothetical protein